MFDVVPLIVFCATSALIVSLVRAHLNSTVLTPKTHVSVVLLSIVVSPANEHSQKENCDGANTSGVPLTGF